MGRVDGQTMKDHLPDHKNQFITKREVLTTMFAQRDVPKQCLTVRDEGMVSRAHRVSEM